MSAQSQKRNKKSSRQKGPRRGARALMPFESVNYVILLASIALIVIGFVVMALANTTADPSHSPLALTAAPLLLVAGYVGAGVAILWRSRDDEAEEDAA